MVVFEQPRYLIQVGGVTANRQICREHFRLTIRVSGLPPAQPGQFVHLSPTVSNAGEYVISEDPWRTSYTDWLEELRGPLLRRAFSIAGLRRRDYGCELDVMYRVVGTSTRWMSSLAQGDKISVMGPLGNGFPVSSLKPKAWLVAGGVGLPPLLWFAQTLVAAGKKTVAFYGAVSAELLALDLRAGEKPAADARRATYSAHEFSDLGVPLVLSTDDGSVGFQGHVGGAVAEFAAANECPADDLVIYSCGPERMMQFVANFAQARAIECYACVERNMACGTGMCQSCIVGVRDVSAPEGWRYRLCCTEGPVFDTKILVWD